MSLKIVEARARASREVIAALGEQLRPFAPAATALAQAWQEQVQKESRFQETAQKNEHELRLRAAQDADAEKIRQSRAQARVHYIGFGVIAFIVLVCVAMAVMVHQGILDKTSALLVAGFFFVLWNTIKNAAK